MIINTFQYKSRHVGNQTVYFDTILKFTNCNQFITITIQTRHLTKKLI